ncbi:MAG: TlpA disulfide reductase family protein [Candidatus Omnitrophica bacterium]|nr:TlpA disulfide reductase family protein [Candidatus Omnitrophota bacterium]
MAKFASAKVLVLILGVFLLGACASSQAIEVGKKAVNFTLNDINGNKVSLADYSGKVVVLDFFADWCPPCRQEVPDFIQLEKQYGNQGFSMIGVALVKGDAAKAFSDKMGINYPVLVDDENVSAAYGPIRSIPTTFVIDKEGKIVKVYIGYRPKDVFEKDIKELL